MVSYKKLLTAGLMTVMVGSAHAGFTDEVLTQQGATVVDKVNNYKSKAMPGANKQIAEAFVKEMTSELRLNGSFFANKKVEDYIVANADNASKLKTALIQLINKASHVINVQSLIDLVDTSITTIQSSVRKPVEKPADRPKVEKPVEKLKVEKTGAELEAEYAAAVEAAKARNAEALKEEAEQRRLVNQAKGLLSAVAKRMPRNPLSKKQVEDTAIEKAKVQAQAVRTAKINQATEQLADLLLLENKDRIQFNPVAVVQDYDLKLTVDDVNLIINDAAKKALKITDLAGEQKRVDEKYAKLDTIIDQNAIVNAAKALLLTVKQKRNWKFQNVQIANPTDADLQTLVIDAQKIWNDAFGTHDIAQQAVAADKIVKMFEKITLTDVHVNTIFAKAPAPVNEQEIEAQIAELEKRADQLAFLIAIKNNRLMPYVVKTVVA